MASALPQAFLFDIGNVLLRLKTDDFLARVHGAHPHIAAATLLHELRDPDGLHIAYERGLVTGREFHAQLVQRLGLGWDYERWLIEWCDYFSPNRPMDLLLAKLSNKAKFFALSNTNAEHYQHLMQQYRLFDGFEQVFASQQCGLRKPEPEFFALALKRIGLPPSQVFYLDDVKPFVEVGTELGLKAFHYTFNDLELKAFLTENGMEVPSWETRPGHLGC